MSTQPPMFEKVTTNAARKWSEMRKKNKLNHHAMPLATDVAPPPGHGGHVTHRIRTHRVGHVAHGRRSLHTSVARCVVQMDLVFFQFQTSQKLITKKKIWISSQKETTIKTEKAKKRHKGVLLPAGGAQVCRGFRCFFQHFWA